jgi:hypothetical protein
VIFKKLRESEEELAEKKFRSLEENYLKEIAELKVFKKIYAINFMTNFNYLLVKKPEVDRGIRREDKKGKIRK